MSISVESAGTKLDITRGKGLNAKIDWASDRRNKDKDGRIELTEDPNKGITLKPTEFKTKYEEALNVGDKFVVREILAAVCDGRMSVAEGQKQLEMYTGLMKGEKDPADAENVFSISYDLRKMRKSGLEKDERNTLIHNAKKAKDLGIVSYEDGSLKIPFGIKAKWFAQDTINKVFRRNKLPSAPTTPPTTAPTTAPSSAPTSAPTSAPSSAPTFCPTFTPPPLTPPTTAPTTAPTSAPTSAPTTPGGDGR